MKRGFVLATMVLVFGLVAAPALAVEWTGQVVAVYPEELVFAIETEGNLVELQVLPQASEELKAQYDQLQVGDAVRVDVDELDMTAMAIEILPSMEPFNPWDEPRTMETMEPKADPGNSGY